MEDIYIIVSLCVMLACLFGMVMNYSKALKETKAGMKELKSIIDIQDTALHDIGLKLTMLETKATDTDDFVTRWSSRTLDIKNEVGHLDLLLNSFKEKVEGLVEQVEKLESTKPAPADEVKTEEAKPVEKKKKTTAKKSKKKTEDEGL